MASARTVKPRATGAWWLLDKSPRQRATTALVALIGTVLPPAALALRLPKIRKSVIVGDALFREALFDDA